MHLSVPTNSTDDLTVQPLPNRYYTNAIMLPEKAHHMVHAQVYFSKVRLADVVPPPTAY